MKGGNSCSIKTLNIFCALTWCYWHWRNLYIYIFRIAFLREFIANQCGEIDFFSLFFPQLSFDLSCLRLAKKQATLEMWVTRTRFFWLDASQPRLPFGWVLLLRFVGGSQQHFRSLGAAELVSFKNGEMPWIVVAVAFFSLSFLFTTSWIINSF